MLKWIDKKLTIAAYVCVMVALDPCSSARNLLYFIATGKPRG